MKVKQLKILEFSDIHLGHPNTDTNFILDNLYKEFKNEPEFGEYDIVFIAGDVFDTLLQLPDPRAMEIKLWIHYFLSLCKKYDVVLRVLEGTPSHEWAQSKYFTQINEMGKINCDLKYIDTLCIEHIERFDIDVLYVPDEWKPECDDIWQDVKQLLMEKNLTQVDFSVMHGAFNYQLPSHIPSPTHIPERYLEITKHLIFIGHIHKHSVNDRIVAAGSFDRLTHGEEEPKGFIKAIVRKTGERRIIFVENESAKIYKTIDCDDADLSKTLKRISNIVKKLPDGSNVRIRSHKEHPILTNLDVIRKKFPNIKFVTKSSKEILNEGESALKLSQAIYKPIKITSKNIEGLLKDRIKNKEQDNTLIDQAMLLIKKYI